jgi:hypothetical protein
VPSRDAAYRDDTSCEPGKLRPVTTKPDRARKRMSTVLGWVAGGSFGLLVNYGLFWSIGPSYPVVPTTFVTFVAGCFAGMWISDRLGPRAFRPLGIVAGVLFALALTLATLVLLTNA